MGKRTWWIILAGGVVAVVAVVAVVFQPQKLFIDDTVDEARPVATGSGTAPGSPPAPAGEESATTTPAPAAPAVLRTGEFASREHATSGTAEVLDLGDGSRVLRIEDLDTSNGPDLFVYLSTNAADGPEGAFDDDFVDLGTLKGNVGNQNYEIPADVDLGKYQSVVIWCRRFSAAFGAAALG